MRTLKKQKRHFFKTIAAALTAFTVSGLSFAHAAGYPEKPVTVILGFAAGGPTDVIGRVLADKLSAIFKQPFVVENRAGASGAVGANIVKKAKPDGYTLMLGSSSTLSIVPNIRKDAGYDPINDFMAIALVANYPYFLVVRGDSPFKTLDDLLAQGKKPSAELNYASAGPGAVNHLAGEWFRTAADINATHIPYKGDAAALSDLIAGRVDFAFIAGAAALPQVEAGRLKILASASSVPGRGGADIPTVGEAKIPGFAAEPWNGLMGPAGMPEDIVEKLNAAVNEAMRDPEVTAKLASMAQYPVGGTPEFFSNHIAEETKRWAKIIQDAHIVID
jgi:tripartite-type tricarboxylate transporter receptor subunit TctC